MAGQTINDRLLAARHSLAGQGLAKSVCKATTEELIAPKRKHLDYLVHCTNEPNVSIPQLANLLVERSQNTNWIVVFKALVTVHHLMCYGNERFTQYLASSNSTFQLSNFLDKSGVQAPAGQRVGYDMSPFIRRHAKYLNEKALSYRTVAFDFCKIKRGKGDVTLRTMNAEKLLKTLPSLQAQLDALLEFDCSANDLTNGVINTCFMLLFRDLIRLFACYNDGIINLLEKYFDMNKKQCREALDLYKKFLIRMDRVAEFLKVAENTGIDKGDIPDLTKAPSSLLEALEQHLAALEGKKGSAANTPTQSASSRTNVSNAVTALSSTSSSFGTAAAHNNARLDAAAALQQTNGALAASIDESLKRQALAEEEAVLNQYKEKHKQSPTQGSSTNPFLSSPTNTGNPMGAPAPIVDLFGGDGGGGIVAPVHAAKASDDLLQLSGNPFADIFGGAPSSAQPAVGATAPNANNFWATNGFSSTSTSTINNQTTGALFVSDKAFSSVFGDSDNASNQTPPLVADIVSQDSRPKSALDDLNDIIKAELVGKSPSKSPYSSNINTPPVMFGSPAREPATGQAVPQQPNATTSPGGKILTGDLDTSLASLAENLYIQPGKQGMQWNSPKNTAKPGTNWTPQPMAATTGANYRPMGPGMQMQLYGLPTTVPIVPYTAMYSAQPFPYMGVWPAGGQQPMAGAAPGMVSTGSPPVQQPPLDPFGAL